MEARRAPGLNNAPLCMWSPSPPPELKEAPAEALDANAGFVTFGISRELTFSFFLPGSSFLIWSCHFHSDFPAPC